jgi:hypothetical protein
MGLSPIPNSINLGLEQINANMKRVAAEAPRGVGQVLALARSVARHVGSGLVSSDHVAAALALRA